MINKYRLVFLYIIILLICSSCNGKNKEDKLKIIVGKEYKYRFNDDSIVQARFYSLSDNSLSFVKVRMEDGKEYTLPQLISGSGVRYSTERDIEFWVKGDGVIISRMNENGEWKVIMEGKFKE